MLYDLYVASLQVFSFQENLVKLLRFSGPTLGDQKRGLKIDLEWLEDWNWKISAASRNHLKGRWRRGSTCSLGKVIPIQPSNTPPFTVFQDASYLSLLKWPWLCSWGVFNKNIGSIWIWFIDNKNTAKKHKDSLWKNLSYGTGLLTKHLHESQWFSDVMMVSQRFAFFVGFICVYIRIYVAMGVNKLRIIQVPKTN